MVGSNMKLDNNIAANNRLILLLPYEKLQVVFGLASVGK